jgi:DNA-binding NtrC family response regulator
MSEHQIVGDRFVRSDGDGWLDLVTGEVLTSPTNDRAASMSTSVRAAARQITELAGVSCIGVRVAEITMAGPICDLALAVSVAVRALGYVTIRSSERVSSAAGPALLSRHLLILCWSDDERETTIWWIRRLARHSPRGHLAVTFRSSPGQGIVDARERAVAYGEPWPVRLSNSCDSTCLASRDRTEIELALDEDGELGRAEALLAAAEAEATLRRMAVPAEIRVRQAELRFWRGSFERVRPLATPMRLAEPELVGWIGLAAWGRGDAAGLESCLSALSNRQPSNQHISFWRAMLSALRPRPANLDSELMSLRGAARSSGLPRRARTLALAAAAEACLAAGDRSRARLVLARRAHGPAPLDDLLLEWLRAASQSNDDRTVLRARIRRAGAEGILRWGRGDRSMYLVQGLPALMQLVQDADDERSALSGGCSWVRRHTGADCVGIIDAEGTEFLASDGWAAGDLFELKAAMTAAVAREPGALATIWAPVRYGRVVIGHVVARGREDILLSFEPAAQALAALVAPAVRTRLDALALSREAHARAPEILGRSAAIASAREAIGRAATTAFPVLIEGESGTGKELVARALHRLSPRRDRAFSALNCAALNDELIEAEMFGHVRGAFTGAVGPRTGLVEQAHGGTLFLDEVSELSARAQAKLLRVLQEREIRRVGENTARHVDVRIVAASNRSLAEATAAGRFREDLLFRLAVVRIRVPPLRDRLEDVPLLAQAFWRRMQADTGKFAVLGPDALAALCRHRWPGNVRELQNAMAALAVIAPARGRVSHRHVQQVVAAPLAADEGAGVPLETARRLFEQRVVAAALARNGGRRVATAHELGLTRQGLAKALRRLGLATGNDSVGVA